MEYLLALEEQLEVDIRSLETCSYSANCLADILAKIQKTVDDLSLRQYSNLPYWVSKLDEEVEKKLGARYVMVQLFIQFKYISCWKFYI